MKKFIYSFILFNLTVTIISAQWQATYLPAQYWPANDIKSHGGQLYVAGNRGVFRSADNGATWSDLTNGFAPATTSGNAFVEFAFPSANEIYVRTTLTGIVRSTDGGTTWGYDTSNIGFNYQTSVLYYDSVSDKLFAGLGWSKYGLYAKQTADPAWTQISSSSFPSNFSPVQMIRKGSKLFVYDVTKRIYESSDDGATWNQKISANLTDASSQEGPGRFLSIGNDLYLGQGGVWKSSDDGDNWTRIDSGFALSFGLFVDTRCLYYDGSILYAGVYAGGETYSSADNGNSWNNMGTVPSFAKAMLHYNGTLYATGHSKDSIYVFGGSLSTNEKANEIQLKVFPNPASSIITIDCSKGKISRVELFDVTGRKISEKTSDGEESGNINFNVSAVSHGIHYLRLTSESGNVIIRKIIIE